MFFCLVAVVCGQETKHVIDSSAVSFGMSTSHVLFLYYYYNVIALPHAEKLKICMRVGRNLHDG